MNIFWKEYGQNWKMHLFMLLQIIFIFALVNLQVSSLAEEYSRLTFAEKTKENVYIYQNSMACLMEKSWGEEDYQKAEKIVKSMEGVKDVGYSTVLQCAVEGYEIKEEYVFLDTFYLSPLVRESMQFHLEKGKWFEDSAGETEEMEIIIGGYLSQEYEVGDTLELIFEEDKKKTARIIGDLGRDPYIVCFSAMGADMTLGNYTENPEVVILTAEDSLLAELEYESYPTMSVLAELQEGADLSVFETYGKMVSFDELVENTRLRLLEFIDMAIARNAVWIVVVVFGVAGTSYLMAQKNRYRWGIYSLMGMSGGEMMRNMLFQNGLTYVAGVLLSVWAYPYIKEKLFYRGDWTTVNWYATAILFFALTLISYLCNRYIYYIEPKEVLQSTKE